MYTTGDVIHLSDKKLPLMYMSNRDVASTKPVLTIENSPYSSDLYLVHPDGRVNRIATTAGGPQDPDYVFSLAAGNGYDLDIVAYQAIIGYWIMNKEQRFTGCLRDELTRRQHGSA